VETYYVVTIVDYFALKQARIVKACFELFSGYNLHILCILVVIF